MTGLWITSCAFTLGEVKLNPFALTRMKKERCTLDIKYVDIEIK